MTLTFDYYKVYFLKVYLGLLIRTITTSLISRYLINYINCE